MPIPGFNLTTSQLVNRWRERQREILETLTHELLTEYRKLEGQIEAVRVEESKAAQERRRGQDQSGTLTAIVAVPPGGFFGGGQRVPLSVHKKKLIEFLSEHGPASRDDIAKAAGIPQGSLSSLLRPPEFERVEHGLWQLKKGGKK